MKGVVVMQVRDKLIELDTREFIERLFKKWVDFPDNLEDNMSDKQAILDLVIGECMWISDELIDSDKKPIDCPFCGSSAKVEQLDGFYCVECTKCPCVFDALYPSEDRAIEVWNGRVK